MVAQGPISAAYFFYEEPHPYQFWQARGSAGGGVLAAFLPVVRYSLLICGSIPNGIPRKLRLGPLVSEWFRFALVISVHRFLSILRSRRLTSSSSRSTYLTILDFFSAYSILDFRPEHGPRVSVLERGLTVAWACPRQESRQCLVVLRDSCES
jgi:hypothetical protein